MSCSLRFWLQGLLHGYGKKGLWHDRKQGVLYQVVLLLTTGAIKTVPSCGVGGNHGQKASIHTEQAVLCDLVAIPQQLKYAGPGDGVESEGKAYPYCPLSAFSPTKTVDIRSHSTGWSPSALPAGHVHQV
jgi:hypothetical protein